MRCPASWAPHHRTDAALAAVNHDAIDSGLTADKAALLTVTGIDHLANRQGLSKCPEREQRRGDGLVLARPDSVTLTGQAFVALGHAISRILCRAGRLGKGDPTMSQWMFLAIPPA